MRRQRQRRHLQLVIWKMKGGSNEDPSLYYHQKTRRNSFCGCGAPHFNNQTGDVNESERVEEEEVHDRQTDS